jgi:hypothetical protein
MAADGLSDDLSDGFPDDLPDDLPHDLPDCLPHQVHEHREAQLNQYMARLLARYDALAAKQRLYATAEAPGTAPLEADELPAALRAFLGVEGDEAKVTKPA